jgi:trimeric autotransporter adhesin
MKLFARFVLSLAVLLPYTSSFAQQGAGNSSPAVVPQLVSFSGLALDAQGKPISGIAGITFSIYSEQYNGAPLWMETQNVIADSQGNYNVQLGATKPQGLPLDLFASGEARWLGVRVNNEEEQPRVLLVSVPYALKAADAQTLGGLPPSAFLLAAPSLAGGGSQNATGASNAGSSGSTPAVGGSGTQNYIPLWTDSSGDLGNSILYQTGTGSTAKIGINEKNPLFMLDVNGTELVRGLLEMATMGYATANKSFTSQPLNLESSAFNSTTGAYTLNHFQWQAEPVGNDTANTGATLNLLYGTDPATPAETGLSLNSKGIFTFAPGQTFPGGSGSGSVTSVGLSAPSTDFTVSGSPVTTSGTLALGWKVVPTNADTPSAIVKRDANGAFSAGSITATAASTSGTAIVANGGTNNASGIGISATGGLYGVYSSTASDSILGTSSSATGVVGISACCGGVYGQASTSLGTGVGGVNLDTGGTGVWADAPTGYGVYATSGEPAGYFAGTVEDGEGFGPGDGMEATGGNSENFYGGNGGVFGGGDGNSSYGGGDAVEAVGGYPETSDTYAGFFVGNVLISGTLTNGASNLKIDHPLDPANKYLYHSFVESPDMMDVYNGNAVLDGDGKATIQMPDWFETLNRDFRYQLTAIGAPGPNLYIAEEISSNHFQIAGGTPGGKVSWQVTGVRQDAWANAHRIPVEQDKPARERGFYLHPELYGAPREKGIEWARRPGVMKALKQGKKAVNLRQSAALTR